MAPDISLGPDPLPHLRLPPPYQLEGVFRVCARIEHVHLLLSSHAVYTAFFVLSAFTDHLSRAVESLRSGGMLLYICGRGKDQQAPLSPPTLHRSTPIATTTLPSKSCLLQSKQTLEIGTSTRVNKGKRNWKRMIALPLFTASRSTSDPLTPPHCSLDASEAYAQRGYASTPLGQSGDRRTPDPGGGPAGRSARRCSAPCQGTCRSDQRCAEP